MFWNNHIESWAKIFELCFFLLLCMKFSWKKMLSEMSRLRHSRVNHQIISLSFYFENSWLIGKFPILLFPAPGFLWCLLIFLLVLFGLLWASETSPEALQDPEFLVLILGQIIKELLVVGRGVPFIELSKHFSHWKEPCEFSVFLLLKKVDFYDWKNKNLLVVFWMKESLQPFNSQVTQMVLGS